MRRGLVHALAWSLATGAAVTLTWWGVHTVMAGTAYDPPRAVPISVSVRSSPPASASSTHRPRPTPSPTPSGAPRATPTPSTPVPRPPSRPPVSSPAARPSPTPSGTVKSYGTDGGRVLFDLRADSAKLVSATPEPGWSMQVWKNSTWIRVDFGKDGRTVSVFCTWNDHPPMVEVV